ncbi:MAG: hypothetical protein A2157_19095 [Deltaproteobacteria bacterium RBG_16_47_11]|nr:MAG: hypothetical protein A2157_19095 [Deltaproteobacteria bacterium RBG_16_47_11]
MKKERRIAIVGTSQIKAMGVTEDQTLTDIIFSVTRKVLDETGITLEEVDAIVMASLDLMDGRSISDMVTSGASGGYRKNEIRVNEEGIYGAILAYLELLSGNGNIALVVSWGKMSEISVPIVTNLTFDPLFSRVLGLNEISAHAIQAARYQFRYGVSREQAAKVVAKNRRNAVKNQFAHLQEAVTISDVINSSIMAWPLHALDLPPYSDGGAALILATDRVATEITEAPAWIQGVGWSSDTYYMGDRDLSDLTSLKNAAQKAYKLAGITDPYDQLDVAEIHDVTSFHELMAYEALGFCSPGKAGELVDQNETDFRGRLPVNPSGGVLSSNPYAASGLIRLAEAALQIMGKAGQHQLAKVNIALAHGKTGICEQGNCVFILGK